MDNTTLIYKVLQGRANEADRRRLADWILFSEANKAEFEDIRVLWLKKEQSPGVVTNFYDGLEIINALKRTRERKRTKTRTKSYLMFVASVLALTCLFSLLYSLRRITPPRYYSFQAATLSVVISTIESDHRVKIAVEHAEVLECKLTGTIYNDETFLVVETVANAMDLNVEKLDYRTYILNGVGCNTIK